MTNLSRKALAPATLAAWLLACWGAASAQPAATAAFPTHCKPGEHAVINAKMGRQTAPGKLVKSGKVVSLCASSAKEPFSSLAYRYGAPGSVEIERVATEKDRFKVYSRSTGPRMSEEIVHFSSGPIHYYVVIAGGMTRGVSVYAYQGGKKIADLFSGIEDDDYQEGPAQISSFSDSEKTRARSPVLVVQAPRDPI